MRKYVALLFVSLFWSFIFGFPVNEVASARDVGLTAASTGYDLVGAVNALRASSGLPSYTYQFHFDDHRAESGKLPCIHRRRLWSHWTRRHASISTRVERGICGGKRVFEIRPACFRKIGTRIPASKARSTCGKGMMRTASRYIPQIFSILAAAWRAQMD